MTDNVTDPNINRNEHDDSGGVLAKRTKSYVWDTTNLAWVKDASGANTTGTWGYNAGTSGTLTLTGGKKVLQITAIAEEAAATITINAGDTITLPYGSTDKVSSSITIEPKGNLVNPTILFSSTVAFFVEYIS